MAFTFTKKVDLSEFGEEWKDSYVVVRRLTFGETKDLAGFDADSGDTAKNVEFAVSLLQSHFVEGKAFNGTELVNLTADDVESLPIDIVNKVIEAVVGTPSPKS